MSVPNPNQPQQQPPPFQQQYQQSYGMPPNQPPPGGPGGPRKKSIFSRWYIWVAAILLLGLTISGIRALTGGNDDLDEAAPTETAEVEETTEPSEAEETEEAEPTPTERTRTDDGLHPGDVAYICSTSAEAAAFPYEITVHYVMGVKQEVINADEIRMLYEATLTAPEGGEITGEVLCVVTGTPDNPEVTDLEVRY